MKRLYMIKFPSGPKNPKDESIFAIIGESEANAISISEKYGLDGIVLSVQDINKDFN